MKNEVEIKVKIDDSYMIASIKDNSKTVLSLIFDKPQWLIKFVFGKELYNKVHRLASMIEQYEAISRNRR